MIFKRRATRPERIDTGDYTPEEYERFLKEIRFINQRLGDRAALEKTLLADVERRGTAEFSVLDVGAGTGELLSVIAEFAQGSGMRARLVGLDINERSSQEIAAAGSNHPEISAVRGDAFNLPFDNASFDYAICSLFTHHLTDDQIPTVLKEMSRVARLGIVVIDLERSAAAWALYQLFCMAYRISPLVRQDGSLSIRKGFTMAELDAHASSAGLKPPLATRSRPYRVILSTVHRR